MFILLHFYWQIKIQIKD